MDGESVKRQVFISYAAKDTDWTAESVAAFAERLLGWGIHVHLDVWRQRSQGQKLADSEWRKWMDESMASATHVVCLCSPRYREAWARSESVSGGCGVAFESTRIEAYLYQDKQNNKGRVLALVTEQGGRKVVPNALRDPCPIYTLGNTDDEAYLRSHLTGHQEAQDPAMERPAEGNGWPAGATAESVFGESTPGDRNGVGSIETDAGHRSGPLDHEMPRGASSFLRFQADHAVDLLVKAEDLWCALRESEFLNEHVPAGACESPRKLVDGLAELDADALSDVMYEIREVFKDLRSQHDESSTRLQMAEATVALYLCCVCRLIKIRSPELVSGLPHLNSNNAANLFAVLIATTLSGGKVSLVHGNDPGDPEMPRSGSVIELKVDFPPQFDPEIIIDRELHTLLVKEKRAHEDGLKFAEPLLEQERSNLDKRLESKRGKGRRTSAMAVLLYSEQVPVLVGSGLLAKWNIPIFSLRHPHVYEILGGVSAESLLAMLRELWIEVKHDISSQQQSRSRPASSEMLSADEAERILRDFVGQYPDHPAAEKISAVIERVNDPAPDDRPQRSVLTEAKDALETTVQIGDAGAKVIPRIIDAIEVFTRLLS